MFHGIAFHLAVEEQLLDEAGTKKMLKDAFISGGHDGPRLFLTRLSFGFPATDRLRCSVEERPTPHGVQIPLVGALLALEVVGSKVEGASGV